VAVRALPGPEGRMMNPVVRAHLVLEAVNSIALEHPDGCRCHACRAAVGDRQALAEIIAAIHEQREERRRAQVHADA
jgi:hypothetical protein